MAFRNGFFCILPLSPGTIVDAERNLDTPINKIL